MIIGAIHWLELADQRLGLMPSAGGSVVAWQWQGAGRSVELWRPWDGVTASPSAMACYPLVPWSNRITGGGFEHEGRFHALAPNTDADPYPLHGDGWLQPWTLTPEGEGRASMSLTSHHHAGNPHTYRATQRFELLPDGMLQTLAVTNQGPASLPFGLGLHPWFHRTPGCVLRTRVDGVWLSRPDKIPSGYTREFPPGWDLNEGAQVDRLTIDNGFGGWDAKACLHWPEWGLTLHMHSELTAPGDGALLDCLLYTSPQAPVFCFEPVTHPIDAAHLPGQPGWVTLPPGGEMGLRVRWRLGV
jgi:aldose 1-epimerase